MFKVMAYPTELIFNYLTDKKKLFARSRKRDVSRGPYALIIFFLPYTQPKMRLGRGNKCDDSGGPHSMKSNFLPAWLIKKRLRFSEIDYSESSLALQTNLVPFAETN
jgi:hypothetical protein